MIRKKCLTLESLSGILSLADGGIAQLGERLNGIQEVSGSIPLISTNGRLAQLVAHPLDVREVTSASLVSSTKKDCTERCGPFSVCHMVSGLRAFVPKQFAECRHSGFPSVSS